MNTHGPQFSHQSEYPAFPSRTLPPLQPQHPRSPLPHPYIGHLPHLSQFSLPTRSVRPVSMAPVMEQTSLGGFLTSSLLSPNQHTQADLHAAPSPNTPPLTSVAQSRFRPIAPAPPRNGHPAFNDLTADTLDYSGDRHRGMAPGMNRATGYVNTNERPGIQLVGAQDHPDIPPCVPRLLAPVGKGINSTAKGAASTAKNADGKFPCQHCNKTYSYEKHLRRHLLRHTGDRPYTCVLCKAAFSRSDTLKRHVQKCPIVRGNPD
ncbi:Zinc finger C2H2 [Penicillium chrysogenum]|uniref:Zinc finger C2H2 n=1 Tax=Penicillium chrysogenum TaxID=5076 RepID=A0ABQ8WE42_PENCH|nr:Zinc finger C2H2 [Penicillium chrysogenum]